MKKQYFKVGDKVTCPIYGKGEIIDVEQCEFYPVIVEFQYDIDGHKPIKSYTLDGRMFRGYKRTLHQGHIDIPEPELKEIVTFEKGEIVWAMDKFNKWHCVKFEEFIPDFPQKILASHPQENSVYCAKEYHDIRKYEDRPF